jgi:hypothetical protein
MPRQYLIIGGLFGAAIFDRSRLYHENLKSIDFLHTANLNDRFFLFVRLSSSHFSCFHLTADILPAYKGAEHASKLLFLYDLQRLKQ